MKVANIFPSTTLFALSTFFLTFTLSFANDPTDKQIYHTVATLINSKSTVHIQGISIEKGDQGKLNLEINASLGNCWGKEELAKGFAREALKALFASDLPVSHVVLHVYGSADILLTVALGKNQAANLNWDKEESLNFFFKRIRSKMNYGGNPADYCWVIENEPMKR